MSRLLLAVTPLLVLIVVLMLISGGYDLTPLNVWVLVAVGVVYLGAVALGRYFEWWGRATTTLVQERDLQTLVEESLDVRGIRRFGLARDIKRLNSAGVNWYRPLSRSLPAMIAGAYASVAVVVYVTLQLEVFTPEMALFLGLSVTLVSYLWVRAFLAMSGQGEENSRLTLSWMRWWGWALLLALLVVLGVSTWWRVAPSQMRVVFAFSYGLAGCGALYVLRARSTNPIALYANLGFAVFGGMIGLAWVITSAVVATGWAGDIARSWWFHDDAAYIQEQEARGSHKGSAVAVTLSGGGYRAAVVHAGVLDMLDKARVPIRYLSTVSGGSIIGGAYGLGWKAEDFARELKVRKPGLPNDLLNTLFVMYDLLGPVWSRTDTLEFHLRLRYFHWHTIADTRPAILIVNTTEYSTGTRGIFRSDEKVDARLAALVAASGAFPGAFEPEQISGKRYMDGGVVENLGVDGLRTFLDDAQVAGMPTPSVLIISDVSKAPDTARDRRKVFFWESVRRAIDLSYQAGHRRLYERYTEDKYDRDGDCPGAQPFPVDGSRLWRGRHGTVWVFVLDPTARAERCRFKGQESLVDRVARISTLKELTPNEVDVAFWAGQVIAFEYIRAICAHSGSDCLTLRRPVPPETSLARP